MKEYLVYWLVNVDGVWEQDYDAPDTFMAESVEAVLERLNREGKRVVTHVCEVNEVWKLDVTLLGEKVA